MSGSSNYRRERKKSCPKPPQPYPPHPPHPKPCPKPPKPQPCPSPPPHDDSSDSKCDADRAACVEVCRFSPHEGPLGTQVKVRGCNLNEIKSVRLTQASGAGVEVVPDVVSERKLLFTIPLDARLASSNTETIFVLIPGDVACSPLLAYRFVITPTPVVCPRVTSVPAFPVLPGARVVIFGTRLSGFVGGTFQTGTDTPLLITDYVADDRTRTASFTLPQAAAASGVVTLIVRQSLAPPCDNFSFNLAVRPPPVVDQLCPPTEAKSGELALLSGSGLGSDDVTVTFEVGTLVVAQPIVQRTPSNIVFEVTGDPTLPFPQTGVIKVSFSSFSQPFTIRAPLLRK